ncbi:hypothetical protein LTR85_008571 [Meristemomyces frigidus]|nr:hypothetical protein LTR85_008571 [Meristemomyces frigidus]
MASPADRKSSPPPYSEHDPYSTDDMLSIQRDCVNTSRADIAQTSSRTFNQAHRVERLRRFLRHALLIDYFPNAKHAITQEDEVKFLKVASYVTDIRHLETTTTMCDTAITIMAAKYSHTASGEVMKYVYDPARQLGVPARVAISMVIRYAAHLDETGSYIGCIRALRGAGCYKELDGKMRIDHALVIPAVVPVEDHDLRCRLRDAADAQRKEYRAGLHALLAAGPRLDIYERVMSIGIGEQRTQEAADDSLRRISQPVTGASSNGLQSSQRSLCHRMLKALGFDAKLSSG